MIGRVQHQLIPLDRLSNRDLFQASKGSPCPAGGVAARAGGNDRHDQEDG